MDLKKVTYVLAIIAGLGLLLSGFFVFSDETENNCRGPASASEPAWPPWVSRC